MNVNRVIENVSLSLKNFITEFNAEIEVSVAQINNNEEFYHNIKDDKRIGEGHIGKFKGSKAYGVSISDIYEDKATEAELTVKLLNSLQSVVLKAIGDISNPILNVLYSENVEKETLDVYFGVTNG